MERTSYESGENEQRSILFKLLRLEKFIDNEIKKIDASGADFMAKDILVKELRSRHNWYETWLSLGDKNLIKWAQLQERAQLDKKDKKNLSFFMDLAEKNYQEALDFYKQGEKNINKVLDQVKNETIESSIEELEIIKNSIEENNTRQVAKLFLIWIHGFRKEVAYKLLTEQEVSYFDEYHETMEAEIDSSDTIYHLLPLYIDKLIEIIRSKKKK